MNAKKKATFLLKNQRFAGLWYVRSICWSCEILCTTAISIQWPYALAYQDSSGARLDHRRSETSGSGGGSSVVLPSLAASHRQHPLPSAHTAINATAHKTISPSSESVAFNTPSQSQELLMQSSPPHSSPDPSSIASIHQPSPLLALPPTVEHLLLFSIDY